MRLNDILQWTATVIVVTMSLVWIIRRIVKCYKRNRRPSCTQPGCDGCILGEYCKKNAKPE